MPQAPDWVTLSKLDVRLSADGRSYVQSTTTRPQPGKRSTKVGVRWQREEHLGGGTFGQVYVERCIEAGRTEEKRAVKRIQKIGHFDYKRELEALAVLSYNEMYRDLFVRFFGWYETDSHVHIAMDLHALGSLDCYLARAQALPESEAKTIMAQVLEALDYMHGLEFIHRDLKPANVLVVTTGPQWWIKIADFGFSKLAIDDRVAAQTGGGTPLYMAPEMNGTFLDDGTYKLSTKLSYSKPVDVWAAGIMTFQMLAGCAPFHLGDIDKYVNGKQEFPEKRLRRAKASDEACDFVRSLITAHPNQRPNAQQCRQLDWLQTDAELHDNPAHLSNSDSEREDMVTELQKESGTWSSEQASQAELQSQEPASGDHECPVGNAMSPISVTTDAAPTLSSGNLAADAATSTMRAPKTMARGRDMMQQPPEITVADIDSTRQSRPCSVEADPPARSSSRKRTPYSSASQPDLLPKSPKHSNGSKDFKVASASGDSRDDDAHAQDKRRLQTSEAELRPIPQANELATSDHTTQVPSRSASVPKDNDGQRSTANRSRDFTSDPTSAQEDGNFRSDPDSRADLDHQPMKPVSEGNTRQRTESNLRQTRRDREYKYSYPDPETASSSESDTIVEPPRYSRREEDERRKMGDPGAPHPTDGATRYSAGTNPRQTRRDREYKYSYPDPETASSSDSDAIVEPPRYRRREKADVTSAREYIERSRRAARPYHEADVTSAREYIEHPRRAPRPCQDAHVTSAREYIERSRGGHRQYQESSRRPSPLRSSAKDKVEYIKRSEGRPPVMVRRGSGKPRPADADFSAGERSRREYSRERRPYSSHTTSAGSDGRKASGLRRTETKDDLPLPHITPESLTPWKATGYASEPEDPTPNRYRTEVYEPAAGNRKAMRSPSPMKEDRGRTSSSRYAASVPRPSVQASRTTSYLYTPQGLQDTSPRPPVQPSRTTSYQYTPRG